MSGFYERSQAERVALATEAAKQGRTLLSRWADMPAPEAEGWDLRSRAAAEHLRGVRSVVDLGCAFMRLERYLEPGVAYIPVDVVRRDERTIVCDFNSDPPPDVSAEAAACLGLIEYLLDPASFLTSLAQSFPRAVISYCVSERTPDIRERRGHAWVNDMSSVEIERLFLQAGWTIDQHRRFDALQDLWALRSTRCGLSR